VACQANFSTSHKEERVGEKTREETANKMRFFLIHTI